MRIHSLGTACLLVLIPALVAAEPFVFTRIGQSAGLEAGDLGATYSIETKSDIHVYVKQEGGGGGGGGGGLGGQRDYQGVTHRLQAAVGLSDLVTAGLSQTFRQTEVEDFSLGVLVPEVRLNLNAISGSPLYGLPVDVSAYFASRLRINARRQTSMVMGIGLAGDLGPLLGYLDLGFETTVESGEQENGLRYQAGLSYRPIDSLRVAFEAWGAMVWPNYTVYQQDHHAGPSAKLQLGPVWLGISGGVGMKERPNKIFVDLSGMFHTGLKF